MPRKASSWSLWSTSDDHSALSESSIRRCIRHNELSQLRQHLDTNQINPNDYLESGICMIHYAATEGSVAVVKMLYEEFAADVNIPDQKTGWTPLMFAARSSRMPVVNYLVTKADADVLKENQDGDTALVLAEHKAVRRFLYRFEKEARGRAAVHVRDEEEANMHQSDNLFVEWFNKAFPVRSGNVWEDLLTRFVEGGWDDLKFWVDLLESRSDNDDGNAHFSIEHVLEHRLRMERQFVTMFRRQLANLRDDVKVWLIGCRREEYAHMIAEQGFGAVTDLTEEENEIAWTETVNRIPMEGHRFQILFYRNLLRPVRIHSRERPEKNEEGDMAMRTLPPFEPPGPGSGKHPLEASNPTLGRFAF